jgi:proteasome lid subunit RPN8/RPN11
MLKVTSKHLKQISTHAEKTYPEECCGLLLGINNSDDKIIVEIWETENSWQAGEADLLPSIARAKSQTLSKCNRFTIAPKVILEAQKSARDRNLTILGIYHSHPDYPAIPSEFDRAIAWEQYSYIIVSVQQGITKDLRCWILDENRQFQKEIIRNS